MRSTKRTGGGIAVGGSLILALLFTNPEVALSQSLAVTASLSNHNGKNISCFGGKDGAIDLTVSGGQAPYTFRWSNGELTEDLTNLRAGYYAIYVKDNQGEEVREQFTLTEPEDLTAQASVHVYPNGKNLSCYQCFNGSITIMPQGGTAPFTYLWSDGVATQHRYNLGAVQTQVTVTDANGCTWGSEIFTLTSPDRSDWTMTGNAGSNPSTQYLGTSDNKDVVFRSNGVERFRITSAGEVRVTSLQFANGYSLLYADSTGALKSAPTLINQMASKPCPVPWPWEVCGNTLITGQWLGSKNAAPLIFKTNNTERMRIDEDGKVLIGPSGYLNQNTTYPYGLYVANGILTEKVKVAVATSADWSDHVFQPGYRLMPLTEVDRYITAHGHLPNVPSAECMVEEGLDVVSTNAMLLAKIEELTLHAIQLEERLRRLEEGGLTPGTPKP